MIGAPGGTIVNLLPAPTSLRAIALSPTKVRLTWNDTASTEDGFKIERKLSESQYAEIQTVDRNSTFSYDINCSPGQRYSYRIRAFNSAGESDYSNGAEVTTPALNQAQMRITGANWVGSAFRLRLAGPLAQPFVLEASNNLIDWTTILTRTLDSMPLNFDDTSVQAVSARFYRVKAAR